MKTRRLLLIIMVILNALPGFCMAGNIFCGLTVYPGSEKIIRTNDTVDSGVAVYRNGDSLDANYDYYKSSLLSAGWKENSITKNISDSLDMPVIIMIKNNRQWYICFYGDSDNMTCALLISGKE